MSVDITADKAIEEVIEIFSNEVILLKVINKDYDHYFSFLESNIFEKSVVSIDENIKDLMAALLSDKENSNTAYDTHIRFITKLCNYESVRYVATSNYENMLSLENSGISVVPLSDGFRVMGLPEKVLLLLCVLKENVNVNVLRYIAESSRSKIKHNKGDGK